LDNLTTSSVLRLQGNFAQRRLTKPNSNRPLACLFYLFISIFYLFLFILVYARSYKTDIGRNS